MSLADEAKDDQWFNYSKFYDFIGEKKYKKFVELGVGKGLSTCYLAKLLSEDAELYAVDFYEKQFKKYFDYNISKLNEDVKKIIHKIKGVSWETAEKFDDASIDFVFIDADHAYESVKKDILAWFPKVRRGGILAGHDYVPSQPGVRRAVDELFGAERKIFKYFLERKFDVNGLSILEKFPKGYCWYVERIDE